MNIAIVHEKLSCFSTDTQETATTGFQKSWQKKYNFAIVIPSGENGFWLDGISTGHKYETLIAEEIIAYIRKNLNLAQKAQDTYIMGLSMGGFGALHTALAHPDVFDNGFLERMCKKVYSSNV